MSYRVVVMVPAEDRPGEFEVWFGRRFMDVSIAFGDGYEIKPLERKEDADLTAQTIYLAMRRLGVEVRVEEYLES